MSDEEEGVTLPDDDAGDVNIMSSDEEEGGGVVLPDDVGDVPSQRYFDAVQPEPTVRQAEPLVEEDISVREEEDIPEASETKATRRLSATQVFLIIFVILTLLFAALFGWAQASRNDGNAGTVDEEEVEQMDVELTRKRLGEFVSSLSKPFKDRTYYEDATLQQKHWLVCTIVQQCLIPKYGLAVSLLTADQKDLLYRVLSAAMTLESYQVLLQQEQANLLLGQYQHYAEDCKGVCVEFSSGGTAYDLQMAHNNSQHNNTQQQEGKTYRQCNEINRNNTDMNATWLCEEIPLALYGNLNTEEPEVIKAYYINDIFEENTVHPRGDIVTYISVYGDMEGSGQFGFRYTGHHVDLNVIVFSDGMINTLPAFFGHNPLGVLPAPASANENNVVGNDVWHNLRGVTLFPKVAELFAQTFDKVLRPSGGFVEQDRFESTPENGGLTLKNGVQLMDRTAVPKALELSEMSNGQFAVLWKLLSYIRGLAKPTANDARLEQHFRETGRLIWTSFNQNEIPTTADEVVSNFGNFYIRVETPDYLSFAMVNQMFTLVNIAQGLPSNHMHGLFIQKSYLDDMTPASESNGEEWPSA